MAYTPEHYTQRDGSACWNSNCWATTGAWLADALSLGKTKLTPTQFRRKAAVPSCKPAGLGNIIHGLMKLHLWRASYCRSRDNVPKDKVRALLKKNTGKLVLLEVDFEDWPTSQAGEFYHSIGVICGEGDGVNSGQVEVMEPLEKRYKWIDIGEVMEAANRYNNKHGEPKATLDFIVITPPKG